MKINGVDISAYNAKQIKVTPGKRTIINESAVMGGCGIPIMFAPEFGIRTYEVVIAMWGNNREEIWENVDRILTLLRNPSDVKLDGFKHNFRLSLSAVQQEEHGPGQIGWHTVTLECKGYEYGEMKEFSIMSPVFEFRDTMCYPDKITKIVKFDMGDALDKMGDKNIIPVPLGIKIEQIYEQDGTPHAIFGTTEISGICKNNMGKNMGNLAIETMDLQTGVEFRGETGKSIAWHQGQVSNTANLHVDMPCIPTCGFEIQPVEIVTSLYAGGGSNPMPQISCKQMKYTFSYTRIYI